MKSLYLALLASLLSFLACKSSDDTPTPSTYPVAEQLATLTRLDKDVNETSGLVMIGDSLFTHNDSNGEARLYRISLSNNEIYENYLPTGAANRDWEDLSRDDTYLYIGDFGNNFGNRHDLTIYRIPIIQIQQGIPTSPAAEAITFNYKDQIRFDYIDEDHNFDCEAFVAFGDNFYLFTKNKVDDKTNLYIVPKTLGDHESSKVKSFDTKGRITSAAVNAAGTVLCLLGYERHSSGPRNRPFVWLFYNFSGDDFFGGQSQRVNMPVNTQMEAIAHEQGSFWLISSEKDNDTDAELYRFDSSPWVQ